MSAATRRRSTSGVYQIPDRFLAKQGRSPIRPSATRGRSTIRSRRCFRRTDFAGVDYLVRTVWCASPEALIERLDNGACQGCHQSGSTAGFHFIGLDDKFTSPLNRIEVGISPHFHAELPRRDAYVAAVTTGREPNRFRPLSFAPPADWQDDGGVAYDRCRARACLA